MTVDDLLQTIQNLFVDQIKYVFNFRDWFKDYIRTPSRHTEPHSYKSELNHDGDVGLWFKKFCMDSEWTALKPILSQIPDGTPSLVSFDWAKQCPDNEIRIKSGHVKLSFHNLS